MYPSVALMAFGLLLVINFAGSFPESQHPDLEYELISNAGGSQVFTKSITTTTRPFLINTPPPPDPNSKTFAYDPISKSWTLVKKTDPPPKDDALLWNQSNDKFLT